jgi:hypothetical protein
MVPIGSICNGEVGLDLIDSYGIQEVIWQNAYVLKIKQIRESQPERLFAFTGTNYQLIFEGEEIKYQKVFDFSYHSNTFSNYLYQKPWEGISLGSGKGSFHLQF